MKYSFEKQEIKHSTSIKDSERYNQWFVRSLKNNFQEKLEIIIRSTSMKEFKWYTQWVIHSLKYNFNNETGNYIFYEHKGIQMVHPMGIHILKYNFNRENENYLSTSINKNLCTGDKEYIQNKVKT